MNLYLRPGGPGAPFQLHTKLRAEDPAPSAAFGSSLALAGDVLVVGAPGAFLPRRGAAYFFELVGGGFAQTAKLEHPPSRTPWGFGAAVAVRGDTILVPPPDSLTPWGSCWGSVHLFERDPRGHWREAQQLVPVPAAGAQCFFTGMAVALDGRQAFVLGLLGPAIGSKHFRPTVCVFTRSAAGWTQTQELLLTEVMLPAPEGRLALQGDRLLAALPGSEELGHDTGAAQAPRTSSRCRRTRRGPARARPARPAATGRGGRLPQLHGARGGALRLRDGQRGPR